jgi:transcriptional regulator with XRE-family HTH domain
MASTRKGVPSKRLLAEPSEGTFRRQLSLRIREARKRLDITQKEFAELLGVSQARIAHYETGRGAPRVHELPSLCRALNSDPNSLLDFHEPLRAETSVCAGS